MPKQKTRKAAAKRFKRTGTGKIKRGSPGRGHLFTGKSRKQKRQLKSGGLVHASDHRRIDNCLAR